MVYDMVRSDYSVNKNWYTFIEQNAVKWIGYSRVWQFIGLYKKLEYENINNNRTITGHSP